MTTAVSTVVCRCGAPAPEGRKYCSDRCCHAATRHPAWTPRACEEYSAGWSCP